MSRAGTEDLPEICLLIWTQFVCLQSLLESLHALRDGRVLPAFLAVKVSVIAWIPVLVFGLAGSLLSVKGYHWQVRCEVNLPCSV